MASLSLGAIEPFPSVSQKASPLGIRKALEYLFSQMESGLWLAGGTALAGFYAEHRRSDDLDLFAVDEPAFRAAVLAASNLKREGALLSAERRTPNYYRTQVEFLDHTFTMDLVLDENLHRVGRAIRTQSGVRVADLPTLFATKAACLVSRCSEKDLFDLDWVFEKMGRIDMEELIRKGKEIDGGLSVESLLISIQGVPLRKEACRFLLPHSGLTVDQAYRKITGLKKKLLEALLEYEQRLPLSKEARGLRESVSRKTRGKK
ncbi:MAG: nucleotidyl transferase AbiEii/AbiGii toxin family protein [Deltaproteobacteria bacterium]|nr:nucleotidyl transferase AbiEii/AbiGii toxin family protein [Deltaproteobacteria bacterium]MBI4224205.1 nucleotidyl transferase AbiEii/AbiGii toxin family protein [Deltaproteobacteria bacterium]